VSSVASESGAVFNEPFYYVTRASDVGELVNSPPCSCNRWSKFSKGSEDHRLVSSAKDRLSIVLLLLTRLGLDVCNYLNKHSGFEADKRT
jgi:hypothetical protein